VAVLTVIPKADTLSVSLAEHELVLVRLDAALDALRASLLREAKTGGYVTPENQRAYSEAVALLVSTGRRIDSAMERCEVARAAWQARGERR
jgi:hypothetical protein